MVPGVRLARAALAVVAAVRELPSVTFEPLAVVGLSAVPYTSPYSMVVPVPRVVTTTGTVAALVVMPKAAPVLRAGGM